MRVKPAANRRDCENVRKFMNYDPSLRAPQPRQLYGKAIIPMILVVYVPIVP